MSVFGWFKKSSPPEPAVPTEMQPALAGTTVCTVKIVVHFGKDGFTWSWHLLSPKRVSQNRVGDIDALVKGYCIHTYSNRTPDAEGVRLSREEVIVPIDLRH